jgi:hypothetical protein
MGLFNSIKKMITIQFIAITLEEKRCVIVVKHIKKSKEIATETKIFKIENKDRLDKKVVEYLNELQEATEQTYISIFLNTLGQGAVSGCGIEKLETAGVEVDSVKHVCIDNEFSVYASLTDIKWINGIFSKVGLDYIYSPFLVLNHCIDKFNHKDVVLYILHTNNGLTLMVKKGQKFLYGTFFNIAKEKNALNEDFDSFSSDDMDDDFMEEIEIDEDFGSDEVYEMAEMNDVMDFKEGLDIIHSLSPQDSRVIKYLNLSLNEFYDSSLYESEFITKIKIYDAADESINEDIIKYIEEDLLLETGIKKINLADKMIEISQKEIY